MYPPGPASRLALQEANIDTEAPEQSCYGDTDGDVVMPLKGCTEGKREHQSYQKAQSLRHHGTPLSIRNLPSGREDHRPPRSAYEPPSEMYRKPPFSPSRLWTAVPVTQRRLSV